MITHEYSSIYDKIFTECKGTFHQETKIKAMFLYDLKEFPVLIYTCKGWLFLLRPESNHLETT